MKKHVLSILILLLLTSLFLMSTSYTQTPQPMSWDEEEDVTYEKPFELPKGDFNPHEKMTEADELFQRSKFNKARDIYEIITYMSKGDTLVKRAQYQLGKLLFQYEIVRRCDL